MGNLSSSASSVYDIIVVGAGIAGLTASMYAARAGKTVLVLERESFGGQIAQSPRVENYPGYKEISGIALADALLDQVLALGVETDCAAVTAVSGAAHHFTVQTDCGSFACRALILAGGADHRTLGLPGEEALTGHGISYCALCDGAFYKDRDVAVVGGGDTAVQDACYLADLCRTVYLIHRRGMFRASPHTVARLQQYPNIQCKMQAEVRALHTAQDGTAAVLSGLTLATPSGEETVSVSALFTAVGRVPATAPFRELVACDAQGYLIAGEDCRTSTPGVFAAGDIRTKTVRQLTTAAADGAVAATAAVQYLEEQKDS